MAETRKSFRRTAPGVITAVVALITAPGGVLATLAQNDIISGASHGGGLPPAGGGANEGARRIDTHKVVQASPRNPWAKATATLVRQDGSSATVKAATVGLACTTETLVFKNGQRVKLELVRSIQFDAIYLENASADGVVTLLDGRQLTDPIHTWNCPITGANELGSLAIQLRDIKRIDFHR